MNNYKISSRLVIKCYHVNEVEFGERNEINEGRLIISKKIDKILHKSEDLIESYEISIIKPREYNKYVNSIMDIVPISTKVLGCIGNGITHTLTGVYVMLTGKTGDGRQMAEFGSSDGILERKLKFGKAGTPAVDDYIIHFDVTVKRGIPFGRNLAMAAHKACDIFIQKIRNVLKKIDGRVADEVHEYVDRIRNGKTKIIIIKQIAGQGAMYDNLLFPNEPSGFEGGRSIIDMGNAPIILSPNEYRDGAIRAMT